MMRLSGALLHHILFFTIYRIMVRMAAPTTMVGMGVEVGVVMRGCERVFLPPILFYTVFGIMVRRLASKLFKLLCPYVT